MEYVKKIAGVCLFILIWSVISVYGGLSGWWLKPIAPPNDAEQFFSSTVELIEQNTKGNIAFALIENGEVAKEYFVSKDQHIDRNSLFPTASFSKWMTAYGVMKLIEQGKIDLDQPISNYLTRWSLPSSEFGSEKVTVRHLLSHTSGLTDKLGFADYRPNETMPSLIESLNQPKASSGKQVKITLGVPVGEEWIYSGGGYLILQLLIEEVTQQGFAEYMQQAVFAPLSMQRSNYDFIGSHENISNFYDQEGNPSEMYQYASSAATGLSSSIADLTRFVQANIHPAQQNGAISKNTIDSMRTPLGHKLGADIWGLGVMLYAPTASGDYVYGHDGSNEPAINSAVRINPETGDAVIVLASGNKTLASTIGYHWVLWQTGYPDFLAFEAALQSAFQPWAIGSLLIILLMSILFIRRR
ncbi:beta-lactamase family protein [Paraneptunicella aestuarii]|uniref:serine hydrolase domain-containing protein n=1 Tax=Paraneptunicella aestuarii TaxID=2831148 RepID=UPI001E647269|nr:serine hydrolase domain-containing protein [Paraneptunicella aestuarii]UAA38055.1 beta-lactamase family protein [Paraneptunicella aestuarii]